MPGGLRRKDRQRIRQAAADGNWPQDVGIRLDPILDEVDVIFGECRDNLMKEILRRMLERLDEVPDEAAYWIPDYIRVVAMAMLDVKRGK